MKRRLHKKGFNIMEVPSLAITLGVIAIVLGIMATILIQVKTTQCAYSYDATTDACLNSTGGTGGDLGYTTQYNITADGETALQDFGSWQTTWVVIIAAAVVIGIVGAYLFFRPR